MNRPNETELVYLPRQSYAPMGVAAGIALIVAGLWSWWPFAVAGTLVLLAASIAWLGGNSDEIARLPREQNRFTSAGR